MEILLQTINTAVDPNTYARIEKANPELFIEEFLNYDLMDFDKIDEIIERGRELGRKHIITILKMIKEQRGQFLEDSIFDQVEMKVSREEQVKKVTNLMET